jgi:4-hydroxybenzoate polyprenyltransferase
MKAGPILCLIRLPNLFTAPVDSLAGWYLADWSARWLEIAPPLHWSVGALIAFASVGLYLGGIVLNDILDDPVDRVERPKRPLPSGAVTRRLAWTISGTGFVSGLFFAFLATGWRGLAVASGLALLIASYNGSLKHYLVGPLAMGLCRGANVLLGGTAFPRIGGSEMWQTTFGGMEVWGIALIVTLFVVGITCISRSEARPEENDGVFLGLLFELGCCFTLILWIMMIPHSSKMSAPEIVFRFAGGGLLGFALLPPVLTAFKAYFRPSMESKQRAVKTGVLALPWLHAGIVMSVGGWMLAGVLVALGLIARRIAKRLYVT